MNLKNLQITVGEVLRNPQARAILRREFPAVANSPMLSMANNMTLQQVLNMVRNQVPQAKINQIVKELQAI